MCFIAKVEVPIPPPPDEGQALDYEQMSDFDFATQAAFRGSPDMPKLGGLEVLGEEIGRSSCEALASMRGEQVSTRRPLAGPARASWSCSKIVESSPRPLRTGLSALVGSCEHGDSGEDTRVALPET